MAVYSVFAPPVSTGEADAERFRFVRDGFSWGAFLFGPLWMIFRRLWLVLIIYLVSISALTVGLAKLPIGDGGRGGAVLLVPFLIALFLGLEGSSLRRWTLGRRGWSDLGIVVGEDLEAAERRFFEAWVAGTTEHRVPASSHAAAPVSTNYRLSGSAKPEVIGLFPDPGGTR